MIIYFHLPRCGGMSMRQVFLAQNPPSDWQFILDGSGVPPAKNRMPRIQQALARGCRGFGAHMHFDPCLDMAGCHLMTVLRDPCERMYSAWRRVQTMPASKAKAMQVPFDRVLRMPAEKRPVMLWPNCMTTMLAGGAPDLEQAKHNLAKHFDFIGWHHDLEAVQDWLEQRHGFNVRRPMMRMNMGQRRKPNDIRPQVMDELLDQNRLDLALYQWAAKEAGREREVLDSMSVAWAARPVRTDGELGHRD